MECNPDCRYLEGAVFQKKREEERKYSQLLGEVGHGQFDDIFQQPSVANMAYDIESFVRDLYIRGDLELTDALVRETYKTIYTIHSERKQIGVTNLKALSRALFDQYNTCAPTWRNGLDETMMGQVYLRLMISIRKMSGGRLGNKSYLNYLKNNLDPSVSENIFIVEDESGNKSIHENK